jgi:glutamate synthase (ferredoxin)
MDSARQTKFLIEKHARYTQSKKAAEVLANWEAMVPKFVKVMPRDYKQVLQAIQNVLASGLSGDDALKAALNAQLAYLPEYLPRI